MYKTTLTLFTVLTLSILTCCSRADHYYTIQGYAQGGTYHITYSDLRPDGTTIAESADQVSAMADELLIAIDRSVSGYNPTSVLTRINSGEDIPADSILADLFTRSYRIWQETGGRFDVSAAPLFDFWGFGFDDPEKMKEIREHSDTRHIIDSLLTFVGMDKVSLDSDRIIKKDPRIKLNFNAIAQGYSCDIIAEKLESMGVTDYLVEVGMEITCHGLNPSGGKWRIGIDAPVDGNMTAGENIKEILEITDCGVVTSGNYRKFYIEDGVKYAHSIDPVTGYPSRDTLLSATVLADNATDADAYATYCMVIGFEKAKQFLSSRDDLGGYLICDGEVWKKKKGQEIKNIPAL